MNTFFRKSPATRQGGFTLLELLAVMGIMAILLAAVVPSISGVNESNNISQAGQTFADQVNLARQIASSQSITVEVRCMKLLPLPPAPSGGYTGIQLWTPSRGTPQPLGRLIKLPDAVAISEDKTTFSTLFASYPSAGTITTGKGNVDYVAFTVSPSGMVGPLPATGNNQAVPADMAQMSVGIVPARLAKTATSLSQTKNYVLVQVNPITASTLSYRP